MSKPYQQLEAELAYVTWQRDKLAETIKAIGARWSRSASEEYQTKGEAITELLMAILGGES